MFLSTEDVCLSETQTINDGMETVNKLRGNVLLSCADGKQIVSRILELSMRAATDVEKRDDALLNPLAPPPEVVRLSGLNSQFMRRSRAILQDEVEIVNQIMSMLLACCLSSVDLLQAFLEFPAMEAWLSDILLKSPEAKIRERTISTLYKLSTIVNDEYVFVVYLSEY